MCFPFLNIVSEVCVINARSAFPPRGPALTIFSEASATQITCWVEKYIYFCVWEGNFTFCFKKKKKTTVKQANQTNYTSFILRRRSVTDFNVDFKTKLAIVVINVMLILKHW